MPAPLDNCIARTTISRKASTDEWVVRAYNAAGDRLPNADYFTNDKKDAEVTSRLMVS